MPACRRDGDDLVLELRVQPRASRNAVEGLHGDRLRVRLRAPPVDGRANEALVALLAETFDIPRSRVRIEHGAGGRDKRVRILGTVCPPPALAALLVDGPGGDDQQRGGA
jgi:uncharacterized protein (TIGR00251 family)